MEVPVDAAGDGVEAVNCIPEMERGGRFAGSPCPAVGAKRDGLAETLDGQLAV